MKSGKGNKQRTVYLPLEVYEKIKWLFRGKIYLFETESKKQYDRTNLYHEIRRQARKHGYDVSPHTLRHSKAMYLKDIKGMSADMVAKALGHSSLVTTLEAYVHGTPSAEEQGIE